MKDRVMITIDRMVRIKAKEICGLVPFSRYVQHLLEKDILERYEEEVDS